MIGDLGAAFYFVPETLDRGKELGLDGFRFYMLGRGGVLGDVEPAVVASAFGYFNPAVIDEIWTSAAAILPPREAGRAYMACAAEHGRRHLGSVDGLDQLCAALEAVDHAAEKAGLALYSGVSAEPRAEDLPGRTMQLLAVLREWRGSAHLLAVRAVGMEPRVAHFLRRPEFFSVFGWSEDDPPAVTDADRVALEAVDQLTDRIVEPAWSVLDPVRADVVVDRLGAVRAAL